MAIRRVLSLPACPAHLVAPLAAVLGIFIADWRAHWVFSKPMSLLSTPYEVEYKVRQMLHEAVWGHPTSKLSGRRGQELASKSAAAVPARGERAGKAAGWMLAGLVLLIALVAAEKLPKLYNPPKPGIESILPSQPFSEEALAKARASGKPVFVYFTADWCLTCKVNESAAIEREETKAAFENLLDAYAQEVRNLSAIRVAILDPGATRTAMRAKAYPGEDPASVKGPEVVADYITALLGESFASPARVSVNQPREPQVLTNG
mgnify:CR=1 FL=1